MLRSDPSRNQTNVQTSESNYTLWIKHKLVSFEINFHMKLDIFEMKLSTKGGQQQRSNYRNRWDMNDAWRDMNVWCVRDVTWEENNNTSVQNNKTSVDNKESVVDYDKSVVLSILFGCQHLVGAISIKVHSYRVDQ